MTNDLMNYTLKEFQEMKYFEPKETFTDIIFVPMEDLHESGFRCMKFILVKRGEIIGVVGGGCDVVHINGIGGYGRYGDGFEEALKTQKTSRVDWSIDCLPGSQCLRLFSSFECLADDFIGLDFSFYPQQMVQEIR